MKKYKHIHILASLKALFFNIFGNKYIMVILDSIATLLITIHTSDIHLDSKEWIIKLIIYVSISIFLNILFVWADRVNKKRDKILGFFCEAYEIQNKINGNNANKLYRVHKKIKSSIRSKKLNKGEINAIADFQTLSFDVCNEIHSFIVNSCGCEECEVTIFQRFKDDKNKDFVTMIAYKNSQNKPAASYGNNYYLNSHRKNLPLLVDIFNDENAEIKILHNPKLVKSEFYCMNNREEKICQYIGIPIKTNRKKVEILLQIDVSKKRVFGMRYKTVKEFAENIFLPFANLLYCSYERDLMLNQFYDVLEDNIS